PNDYVIVTLGSTPKRGLALIDSKIDSTILNAGNEIKAVAAGATKVADIGLLGPYIGTVFGAIGSSTENTRRLIAIIERVSSEILAGAHQDLVIEIAGRNLQLSRQEARAHYQVFLDPTHGLINNGETDKASIETLINLRREYAPTPELEKILSDLPALLNAG